MTSRYFLLYHNGKVRELSQEETKKTQSKSVVVAVSEYGLRVDKGEESAFLFKKQLLQVLELASWIKTEVEQSES